jgi:hypothetical protein
VTRPPLLRAQQHVLHDVLRQVRVAGQRGGETEEPIKTIGDELVEGVQHRDSVLVDGGRQ